MKNLNTMEQIPLSKQDTINEFVKIEYFYMQDKFGEYIKNNGFPKPKRLFNCQARYYLIDDYIILESYNTIIAFIDKSKRFFIDCLRYIYGYTATSCQHIAKFKKLFNDDFDNYYQWRYTK